MVAQLIFGRVAFIRCS
uniref:Uncharacterized protein n=1 Tax=Arundo donax TaxID=35708 RepID=A0A0A8ZUT0_ARUDO